MEAVAGAVQVLGLFWKLCSFPPHSEMSQQKADQSSKGHCDSYRKLIFDPVKLFVTLPTCQPYEGVSSTMGTFAPLDC